MWSSTRALPAKLAGETNPPPAPTGSATPRHAAFPFSRFDEARAPAARVLVPQNPSRPATSSEVGRAVSLRSRGSDRLLPLGIGLGLLTTGAGCADVVPPTIVSFEASATQIAQGDSVQFEWYVRDNKLGALTCSFDADGDGTAEDVTEGCVGSGSASHTYRDAGSRVATLTVTDKAGNVSEASHTISAAEPVALEPGVHILGPAELPGGTGVFSFPDLGTEETVAVLAVNANPANALSAQHYRLSVSGFSASRPGEPTTTGEPGMPSQRSGLSSLAARSFGGALLSAGHAQSPADPADQDPRHRHLSHLERSSQLANQLVREGYRAGPASIQRGDSSRRPQAGSYNTCVAPYSIGKACQFYLSISDDAETRINTQMQYESESAYWFIDDDDLDQFTPSDLQELAERFEAEIVPADNRYFGEFSDVDQNGKILIVFSGLLWDAGILGYVYSIDLYTDEDAYPATGVHSNEGDIFYATSPNPIIADGYATRKQYDEELMPATLVHELKHLISSGVRVPAGFESEELWIEEASAQAAQELIGLGDSQYYSGPMLQDPQNFNVVYEGRPAGVAGAGIYGYNFLFVWRVAETVGHDAFWKPWTAGPYSGISNLERHSGMSFEDIMNDWALTLLFDHTELVSGYDFNSLSIRQGWSKLGYSPLASSEGHARSMAYFVGRGGGGSASVGITSTSESPSFAIARFTGSLPYTSSTRTGGDISGTLRAISGAKLKDAWLFGCPVDDYCSYFGQVEDEGTELEFVMPALPAGDYYLYVWRDANGNDEFDEGDSFGYYSTNGGESEAPITVPKSGIQIDVYPL